MPVVRLEIDRDKPAWIAPHNGNVRHNDDVSVWKLAGLLPHGGGERVPLLGEDLRETLYENFQTNE